MALKEVTYFVYIVDALHTVVVLSAFAGGYGMRHLLGVELAEYVEGLILLSHLLVASQFVTTVDDIEQQQHDKRFKVTEKDNRRFVAFRVRDKLA